MILKILYAWKLHNDSDIMLSCSSQKGANCLDNKVYSFTQLSTFVLPAITTVSKQNLMANWLVLYQCEHVWCFSEFRGLWEQCVRAEGQYPVAHCHRSWGFNCLVNTGIGQIRCMQIQHSLWREYQASFQLSMISDSPNVNTFPLKIYSNSRMTLLDYYSEAWNCCRQLIPDCLALCSLRGISTEYLQQCLYGWFE